MKKKLIITIVASVLTIGTISAMAINVNPSETGADTSPVVTELDNHEVRIKNAENNIKDLQTKTNTPDSSANTSVPVVNSTITSPATSSTDSGSAATVDSTPPSTPVVVSYREIPISDGNSDCEYTYSDSSTYQFAWKRTNPQGSWVTDGNGNNGHWVAVTNTTGKCDSSVLGKPKTN